MSHIQEFSLVHYAEHPMECSEMQRDDGGHWVRAEDHDRVVRWFRAKVMRERADAHKRCAYLIGLGSILSPFAFPEPRHQQLLDRARRLRAKADRVEKGTP